MSTAVANPDQTTSPDTQPRTVQYPHPTDSSKQGAVVQFPSPAEMDEDSFASAASRSWDFLKSEAGALGQSFGLPTGSKQEFDQANSQLVDQLKNPARSAKQIGSALWGSLNNSDLIDAARNAKTPAERVEHTVNAAIPVLGHALDQAGIELSHEDFARGIAHTIGAALPFLMGGAEAPESVAKSPVSVPKGDPWNDVLSGHNLEPKPAPRVIAQPWNDLTAEPMNPVQRSAAAYMRRQGYDRTPTPNVEVVGARPTEPATKIAGESTRVKNATPDAATSQTEINDAARSEIVRATTSYDYAADEGEVSTIHRVKIADEAGKPAGEVTAIASKDEPNTWQVDRVEATQKQGTGSAAFRRLFKAAQQQADQSGEPVTVRGGSVKTPEAKNMWARLKQDYPVKNGSVTFTPTVKPDWRGAIVHPTVDLTDDYNAHQ